MLREMQLYSKGSYLLRKFRKWLSETMTNPRCRGLSCRWGKRWEELELVLVRVDVSGIGILAQSLLPSALGTG